MLARGIFVRTRRRGSSCCDRLVLRAFSSLPSALDTATRPDVVVIGAGCAGVACASALASEGVGTLLLEQDPRHLGGRARSWPCPETGHPMHIGPHIVYSDYPNYFKLIKLLDPEGKERVVWQRQQDVFTTVNGVSEYDDKQEFRSWPVALTNSSDGLFRVPPPLNWISATLRDPFVPGIRDMLSLVPFASFCMQLQGNNEIINTTLRRATAAAPSKLAAADFEDLDVWRRLDEVSGQEVLDAFAVSPAYQKHIMAFTSNSILNVPLSEVSGASLVSWFRKLIGRPGVRLGFIDGGLGTVLEPVGDFLEKKQSGGLRMGVKVTAVRRVEGEDGSNGCNLEVEMVDASGQVSVVRPRHGVVVTVPPLEALKLLPEQDRSRPLDRLLLNVGQSEPGTADTPASVLSRFKPCKYVSVYLWFDRDIRDPKATAQADASDPIAFSGHQFWAKRYDPDDFCCEFYDYSKIYTRDGTTPKRVLDDLGIVDDNEGRTAGGKSSESSCVSMVGVNMIDVDRLDPPNSGEVDPVCSFPAPLSSPAARHLAASDWSDEQLVDRALEELKESVGEQLFNKEARLLKGAVHRIPMAIPRMVVGTEMRRPVAGELHADSRLFLAGDYCQTGFMNCMEGATQAGFECADEVLAAIHMRSDGAGNPAIDADRVQREDIVHSGAWALPHPEISRFARFVSKYLIWPVSRRLWSKQMAREL